MNIIDINTTISTITLNVNGLNAPIKRKKEIVRVNHNMKLCVVYKKLTLNINTHIDKSNRVEKNMACLLLKESINLKY